VVGDTIFEQALQPKYAGGVGDAPVFINRSFYDTAIAV
jgi:hypothetical protein